MYYVSRQCVVLVITEINNRLYLFESFKMGSLTKTGACVVALNVVGYPQKLRQRADVSKQQFTHTQRIFQC